MEDDCGGGNDDSGKRYGDGGGHGWAMIVLEESNSRSGGRRFRALLTTGWPISLGPQTLLKSAPIVNGLAQPFNATRKLENTRIRICEALCSS